VDEPAPKPNARTGAKGGKSRKRDNASHAREKVARAKRRVRLAKLNLDGWTQQEIAAELKIDKTTVCRELAALRAEWAAEHKAAQHEHVERELVSLQRDEKDVRERLESIEREDQDAQAEIDRLRELDDESSRKQAAMLLEALLRRDDHRNAAKWHEVLLKIRDRRAKLLGLDAPTKVEQKVSATVTDRRLALEQLGPDASKLAAELAAKVYSPRPSVVAALETPAPSSTNGTNGVAH